MTLLLAIVLIGSVAKQPAKTPDVLLGETLLRHFESVTSGKAGHWDSVARVVLDVFDTISSPRAVACIMEYCRTFSPRVGSRCTMQLMNYVRSILYKRDRGKALYPLASPVSGGVRPSDSAEVVVFLDVSQSMRGAEDLLTEFARNSPQYLVQWGDYRVFLLGDSVRPYPRTASARPSCEDSTTSLLGLLRDLKRLRDVPPAADILHETPSVLFCSPSKRVKIAVIVTDGIWSEEKGDGGVDPVDPIMRPELEALYRDLVSYYWEQNAGEFIFSSVSTIELALEQECEGQTGEGAQQPTSCSSDGCVALPLRVHPPQASMSRGAPACGSDSRRLADVRFHLRGPASGRGSEEARGQVHAVTYQCRNARPCSPPLRVGDAEVDLL